MIFFIDLNFPDWLSPELNEKDNFFNSMNQVEVQFK